MCLYNQVHLYFDPKTEIFKDFYSNPVDNLVKKLPSPPKNLERKLASKGIKGRKALSLQPTTTRDVQKLLEDINPTKSAESHNFTGKFSRNGAPVLAAPISGRYNLSISLSNFPDDCIKEKLKPIYKNESKTDPKKSHTDLVVSINLQNHGKDN